MVLQTASKTLKIESDLRYDKIDLRIELLIPMNFIAAELCDEGKQTTDMDTNDKE